MRRFLALLVILATGLAAQADTQETRTYPVLRPRLMFTPDVLAALPHRDFPGDLVEAWVTDVAGYLTYVDQDTLDGAGQTQAQVEARALQALRDKARGLSWQPIENVQALTLDGVYESSILLLPEVWQGLAQKMGQVVVAVPTRDVVLLADGRDAAQIDSLRRILAQVRGKFPNPVTGLLFAWDGAGWVVLPR